MSLPLLIRHFAFCALKLCFPGINNMAVVGENEKSIYAASVRGARAAREWPSAHNRSLNAFSSSAAGQFRPACATKAVCVFHISRGNLRRPALVIAAPRASPQIGVCASSPRRPDHCLCIASKNEATRDSLVASAMRISSYC